jgi:integrase
LATEAAGRRELEDLRAAIRLAFEDRILTERVHVTLPDENPGREVWLTEDEVETLCRIARETQEMQRRHRGSDKGKVLPTGKRPLAHVEKFVRVAVQTGTRSGAVCGASFEQEAGRPWIDLDGGMFYRRPFGKAEGKTKRYPPAPLSPDLVEEMREWRNAGARYVVEYDGKPVANCRKAFERLVALAKLDKHVVRHTLRHTAATWMMQDGIDFAEAAGYLGMTVETLQRTYGHHHPDYQRRAAASLSRRANRARASTSANVSPMKPVGNTGISEEARGG